MEIEWLGKGGKTIRAEIDAAVQPYVDAIGLEMTAKLLLELGGAEMYVTPTPKSRSRLVEVVGEQNAIALGKSLCAVGMSLRIPIGNNFLCQYLRSKGATVAEIARKTRLSTVSVRKVLRGKVPKSDTPKFGEVG